MAQFSSEYFQIMVYNLVIIESVAQVAAVCLIKKALLLSA
jgi:hypothetical protein